MLTPSRECNNAVVYCLIVAVQKTGVCLLDFMTMPNHPHYAVLDRKGEIVAFYTEFHRLLAKCRNAQLGRWENFWASQQTNVVRLETRDDLMNKLVYIATNPVTAGLVERVEEWPGAFGYLALINGEPLRATRPTAYFDKDGDMPTEVELMLRIPPELGDHDAFVAKLKRLVEAVEFAERRKREETGRKVLGRNAVMRRSWRESPTSKEPRRGLRPTLAAKDLWRRLEAIQRRRDFLAQYRLARQALLAGAPIPFPHGTYWLARFMNVAVGAAGVENN
ncbi:MAG: hypothetical protein JNL83_14415 [Myxococcales bacterium]|nr:hypothetical protein [Myxococcales bacterium]